MINVLLCMYLKELGEQLLKYSVPTSDDDHAPNVVVTPTYFNYELLWTLVGAGGISIVVSCICCIALRDIWRHCHSRRCCIRRLRPHKLPQRKYKKRKEVYETCAICQDDFKDAELVRVLPCKHSELLQYALEQFVVNR